MNQPIDPRLKNKQVQKEFLTLVLKSLGGSSKSERKVAASRENAAKATAARKGKKFPKVVKLKIKPAEDWD
jgi:hypothetical protein